MSGLPATVEKQAPPQRVRLATLPMVWRLVEARDSVAAQLARLGTLRMSLDMPVLAGSNTLDAACVEAVTPVLRRLLEARLRSIDLDLEALGVQVG